MSSSCTGSPGDSVPYLPPPNFTHRLLYPFPVETVPDWEIAVKSLFYSVAMIMAVVGNAVVIVTVVLNVRMRTSTNIYLVNLAISDFMVGATNMWMHLVISIETEWPFGLFICKAFPFLQIVWLTASVLFMTVIACERFFVIVFPLRARFSCKPYQHVIVISLMWSLAVLVAIPNILVSELNILIWKNYRQVSCDQNWPRYVSYSQPANSTGCNYDYPSRQIYYNLQAAVMYFAPVFIMAVAYGVILYKMHRRKMPGNSNETSAIAYQRTSTKVIRMLVVVLVVFVVCWTPQEVIVVMEANWPLSVQVSEGFRYAAIYVAYFNSSLNPIIYAGLNEKFRQGFRELFRCRSPTVTPVTVGTVVVKVADQRIDESSNKESDQRKKTLACGCVCQY